MKARPRQHHYVTKAYLEGFLEPGKTQIYCYGRRRPDAFSRRPEDLAKQRDYYSFRRSDGSWDDTLEHLLGEKIETPGIDIVKKLVAGDRRLKWPERQRLSMFIATQRMRVPYFREMLDANYKKFVHQLLKEYAEKELDLGFSPGPMRLRSIGPFDDDIEDTKGTLITKEQLQKTAESLDTNPRQFSLESFLELAVSWARIFERMRWTVHYAPPGERYLTSDAPVIVRFERDDIKEAALVRPDCEIQFPLANTCLLSMTHDFIMMNKLNRMGRTARAIRALARIPEIRILQATSGQVKGFNQNQIDFASRWVFSGLEYDWLPPLLQAESRNTKHVLSRESENRLVFQSLK